MMGSKLQLRIPSHFKRDCCGNDARDDKDVREVHSVQIRNSRVTISATALREERFLQWKNWHFLRLGKTLDRCT